MRSARRHSTLYRALAWLLASVAGSALVACDRSGAPTQVTAVKLVPRVDTLPVSAGPDTVPGVVGKDTLAAPTGSASIPARMAELPRATVVVTYPEVVRTVKVPAGADLQVALDDAQPGDELLLASRATYVGNFLLTNKGPNTAWIVIRTDLPDEAIGAQGKRMTPTRAAIAGLAKILTPDDQPAIGTSLGANHYRFTGVEIAAATSAANINALVRFGTDEGSQRSAATTASNLIVERSYVHGAATLEIRRCVALNSSTSAVVDSWLADCHSNVSDSQAIAGWNGPGPFLIQNNHLEAGHEIIAFGGGSFTQADGSPSDITVRGNHIMRPLAWKGIWEAKNLLETKHAKRMLIEGNVFENNWVDGQAGFAFVIKSENQNGDTPWTQSADITIRYNRIRNTGNVINLAAGPTYSTRVAASRITITDNLVENVNVEPYKGDGHTLQLLGELEDVVMMHNTVTSANGGSFTVVLGELPAMHRLVLHSNVLQHGAYGIKGGGVHEGAQSLELYAPDALVTHNLFVGGGESADYPLSNYFSSSMTDVGFRDVAAGDYRLDTSSYRNRGLDGRDIGADIDRLEAETRGAVVAP
jgi:hypothetical protein